MADRASRSTVLDWRRGNPKRLRHRQARDRGVVSATVEARIEFTSYGERLVTEPYDIACASGDEISAVEDVDVSAGTKCDMCGEEIPACIVRYVTTGLCSVVLFATTRIIGRIIADSRPIRILGN